MNLSSQIVGWRRIRGLTQAALAARAGLTRPYISRLERGDVDPALSSLRRLATALEIAPGRLIDEPPPQKQLDRIEMDLLARGALFPGVKTVAGNPEVRALARIIRDRRRALGLFKPRKSGRPPGTVGKHAARWLKARLGEEQWEALLRRIDKLISLRAG